MLIHSGKGTPLARRRHEDWDEAREAYLLEHAPGLKEHYAAQQRAFLQIEQEAQNRHPDPSPDDIAAAVAAEAAFPYRKRTEAQLRRDFEPLAAHLPQDVKSKRFVQRGQRAWNRANPIPLTDETQRALTAEFVKTYAEAARSNADPPHLHVLSLLTLAMPFCVDPAHLEDTQGTLGPFVRQVPCEASSVPLAIKSLARCDEALSLFLDLL